MKDQARELDDQVEPVGYDFGLTRRSFVQILGAGLVVAATANGPLSWVHGQQQQRGRPINLDARLHIAKDRDLITVMTGKVEGGQGSRAQITQAACEELGVPMEQVTLIMADTSLVPDDGPTAGSRTTPNTLPAVRQACAAARGLLVSFAARKWNVEASQIQINSTGAAVSGDRVMTYRDLASAEDAASMLQQVVPGDVVLKPVDEWKILGTSVPRPGVRNFVTGKHQYPSDIVLDGMLYGKILRPPSFGAKLASIDLEPAKALDGVIVVRDGDFVGVAAPTTYQAKAAIRVLEESAQWDRPDQVSSAQLFEHLRSTARGGMPENPFAERMSNSAKTLTQQYDVSYIQHAPLEPRAAVAQWQDGKVSVWTSTQRPFGVRDELVNAFRLSPDRVRVIIPDFGGGFGGKHTGETAIEAARLAQAAQKPVTVRWTRTEEFTWAYFRPAAAINVEASLDPAGMITSWHFVNVNSGNSAIESPYTIAEKRSEYREAQAPLRHGSYRALAATANCFAREAAMDELAELAGFDPLEFRLKHLAAGRLRDVLEAVARRAGFASRRNEFKGIGIACGTEKGSYVASCAEVTIDPATRAIQVKKIITSYECGAITTPANLLSQVQGGIVMALGPALREEMKFENGQITNPSMWTYAPPRMSELPEIDIELLDRKDLPSVGAGETPLIAVAPAIANAVFHATGTRIRTMPIRLA